VENSTEGPFYCYLLLEQPLTEPSCLNCMDHNTEILPPQNGFWKGVLIGSMVGMVIATYAYYITELPSKQAEKNATSLKLLREKQEAA